MANKTNKILIALSGGGTGGPVVPLLNVARVLKRRHSEVEFLFFGTISGPELSLVKNEESALNIKYLTIQSGKFRRYFSWRNFSDLFLIIFAFFQAFFLLIKYRPRALFSAGGFVAVPPAWAAKILGIPVLMHQQDSRPGLANKMIAPVASSRTVTFEKSLQDYKKALWIGNPLDEEELRNAQENLAQTKEKYHLTNSLPIILVTGGGTGADYLNNLVQESRTVLQEKFQIIHLCGSGKRKADDGINYQAYDFLPHAEIIKLMALSDLIISRCGLGTLSEISLLAKPAILIPIPDSHQEDNANLFKDASVVLSQKELSAELFIEKINQLFGDKEELNRISTEVKKMIKPGAAEFLAEKIYEYSRQKN